MVPCNFSHCSTAVPAGLHSKTKLSPAESPPCRRWKIRKIPKFGIAQYFILNRLSYRAKARYPGTWAARVRFRSFFSMIFTHTEKRMRNYDDELALFSDLLDQRAEVFTKKMFRHSQAKAQENWSDMKKDRQTKRIFTTRSRSRRSGFGV